jgi:dienelactone hydrolase
VAIWKVYKRIINMKQKKMDSIGIVPELKSGKSIFSGLSVLPVLLFLLVSLNPVRSQSVEYETTGVSDNLPVFYKKMTARMDYKLSWLNSGQDDFETWRKKAREKVMECLMAPPPFIPFDPVVIDSEDRGTYIARNVVFNVTGYSRVLALMLVPKSQGPHPAVLLLHDHGAYFKLGKEKVIRPFHVSPEVIDNANKFTKLCYGDRFIGDELAKRGYVCLAVDMLNWGDRQGGGYIGQQAIASNFFNLGGSFAGLIAYEDMSAATFLSRQPEVDSTRIAAVGLSIGSFRTWQIAALSQHIAAGVAVCWMSTRVALMSTGNNQTGGQSAFTCTHPGLAQYLDYPDVASIACPKPMMVINGNADDLFPLESIKEAYSKMHKVWDSQNVSEKLVTKLYDAPHEFNLAMQKDAFSWLDIVLNNKQH